MCVRRIGHPPSWIDIIKLFQIYLFLPTSLPTNRKRGKDRKERKSFHFSFLFSAIGSGAYPQTPLGKGGSARIEARPAGGRGGRVDSKTVPALQSERKEQQSEPWGRGHGATAQHPTAEGPSTAIVREGMSGEDRGAEVPARLK
jgi:hypothetical protein